MKIFYYTDNVKSFQNLKEAFDWANDKGTLFVIGGSQIFNECCNPEYIQFLDTIYLTKFNNNYHPRNTTYSFPLQLFHDMKLLSKSEIHNEICFCFYIYAAYVRSEELLVIGAIFSSPVLPYILQ